MTPPNRRRTPPASRMSIRDLPGVTVSADELAERVERGRQASGNWTTSFMASYGADIPAEVIPSDGPAADPGTGTDGGVEKGAGAEEDVAVAV